MKTIRARLAMFLEWLGWQMSLIAQALDEEATTQIAEQQYDTWVKRCRDEF